MSHAIDLNCPQFRFALFSAKGTFLWQPRGERRRSSKRRGTLGLGCHASTAPNGAALSPTIRNPKRERGMRLKTASSLAYASGCDRSSPHTSRWPHLRARVIAAVAVAGVVTAGLGRSGVFITIARVVRCRVVAEPGGVGGNEIDVEAVVRVSAGRVDQIAANHGKTRLDRVDLSNRLPEGLHISFVSRGSKPKLCVTKLYETECLLLRFCRPSPARPAGLACIAHQSVGRTKQTAPLPELRTLLLALLTVQIVEAIKLVCAVPARVRPRSGLRGA